MHHNHSCDLCGDHTHSIWSEIICHVPYTGFSIAIGFILLSIIQFIGLGVSDQTILRQGYHVLFHTFHYVHIVVAVAGAAVMFFRHSRRWIQGILVALLAPTFFCVISDIILPALAGRVLGVTMDVHICFCHWEDALNLFAFMGVGLLSGIALLGNKESLKFFSVFSHFFHILVSSLAALFYMVAHGFDWWYQAMGILFVFLFIAVIVPCTLSDVVVPMYLARLKGR